MSADLDRHHIKSVESDMRYARELMTMLEGWIAHWQEDVSCNLKPTTQGLEQALWICRKARAALEGAQS